ncbi:MAG: hypothetical protein COA97_12275 [Flavobacteriales bacterium]|nr:MAG: hypothetical protein COA97_12275 [Flavobacteriales bacterium]
MHKEDIKTNKGRIYIFWGWNRGYYTNSDIQFTGDNYDFKLNDVEARDRQSKFGLDPYFNPSRITIPQTNFRIGFFVTNNIDLSIGVDHMKYVMVTNQETEITGEINDGSNYDGTYDNDDITISQDFLRFEHTDGLNYLNIEITRNDDLLKLFKINMNPNKIEVNALIGFGIGALMPKSNVTLWNKERYDEFDFAGYGLAGKIGLNVTFFNTFFIRGELKEGFIDMPNIRTSPDPSDRASQHFFFTQLNFSFGFAIHPF